MKKKLLLNTVMPLFLQLVTIISGFIIPRMIIYSYGSSVNGLIHSITQFLSIISFMEAGVGSVIRFNLYKPLANQDNDSISRIMVSARKFYRMIAYVLLGYTAILVFAYPLKTIDQFGYLFTAMLIVAISFSTFSQYFFGQINQLLLTADQKGYIHYVAQIFTIIANTIASVILIKLGAGIQFVKITTAIIYLIRPLFLQWYVNRSYSIDYSKKVIDEPIKQKWNGLAQHISYVVLDQTDIIVLTLFSTLSNVSIYSVYQMVVAGVKTLLTSMTNGIEAYLGKVIANEDKKQLDNIFSYTEWIIHNATLFFFGCTTILIVPFVSVYTKGIMDADYYVPVFAVLISLANAGHCLRLPYSIAILSAGHYKQTQWSYIFAAILNISISIGMVIKYGLIGVAIGTLCAMFFQTIWMALYSYKHILNREIRLFTKQFIVDLIVGFFIGASSKFFVMKDTTYMSWIVLAIKYALLVLFVIIFINLIFYRENLKRFVLAIKRR